MPKFRLIWDVGHACDAFPWLYDTEEAARNAGFDWLLEQGLDSDGRDIETGEETECCFEVEEVKEDA